MQDMLFIDCILVHNIHQQISALVILIFSLLVVVHVN